MINSVGRVFLAAIGVFVAGTVAVVSGGIDWATPATDVSGSLQGAADAMIPFVVSGGALAAGFYMQNLMPAVIGMTGACYLAANSDQAQAVFGGGGGGGLITDTVYSIGTAAPDAIWLQASALLFGV